MPDRALYPVGESAATAVEVSSLDLNLQPLRWLLNDVQVTEICINRPLVAHVERYSGWSVHEVPFATYDWCNALARLVGNYTKQRVSSTEPLMSATLPSGERVQFVLPPAVEPGCVSITIRKPASVLWTLDDLACTDPVSTTLDNGEKLTLTLDVFRATKVLPLSSTRLDLSGAVYTEHERELLQLLHFGDFKMFLRRAVQCRMNILLSGATGSGKTTIAKALILEVPADDRIIAIEDVPELILKNQPNHVRLFYSQGGQGQANVSGKELLVSAKRMRPDRVFVSELRTGTEAYDYLVSVNSGHPGSITSVHANSAQGAFLSLGQLMQLDVGCSLEQGVQLAQYSVDVVVQCSRAGTRRYVSEIWFDPTTKRKSVSWGTQEDR